MRVATVILLVTFLASTGPARADFWGGFSSGLQQQWERGEERRNSDRIYMSPGQYDAQITSSGMNRFTVLNGGPDIRTRLCFHSVELDNAVLVIERVKGPTVGTLKFSDGTVCTVNRVE